MATAQIELTLTITEEERSELLHLLNQAVTNTHMERRRTESPEYQREVGHEEDVLRSLAEKVRQLKK